MRTRVGYAGGTTPDPTYHNLGDHTETIQIDYDPTVISYETLLGVFWDSHEPAEVPWTRQYMSILFTHDEAQKKLATASLAREEARIGRKILTELRPAGRFYRAEAYHQKYLLRSESEIARGLERVYPTTDAYVDSTVAARINGYLGSYGTLAELREALPGFGLSPRAAEQLTRIVSRRPGRPGCPL